MLATLTSDYDKGLKVLDKINKLKIVKHSEKSHFTYGFKEVMYLYSTREYKESHRKEMLDCGWKEIEGQTSMSIYVNFYEQKYIRVPCNAYKKSIEHNNLLLSD